MTRFIKPFGIFLLSLILLAHYSCKQKSFSISNLTVEYRETPLGLDVEVPRFSWQMAAPEDERGYFQTAHQLVVTNPLGEVVWDSGKTENDESVAISYQGKALNATTKYNWTVKVWNQLGEYSTQSSWFETGLMNPSSDLSAWDGAQWIGGSDDDLVFYSQYLVVFKLKYSLEITKESSKAGFIYGANDLRLMNKYRNIFQVENKKDESYIKLELDISGLNNSADGLARLNIYRVGYTKDDKPDEPFKTLKIRNDIINNQNLYKKHTFEVSSAFGRISINIDGNGSCFTKSGSVNLNPVGSGGDYLPFGLVCDIGFSMDKGQKANFSEVEVFNDRLPNNTLFKESPDMEYSGVFSSFENDSQAGLKIENDNFILDGGQNGTLITADPSRNGTPMLRTEFSIKNKKIENARLYITSRGIYEVYINGKRIGNDYYNPGLTQYNKTHLYQTYDVSDFVKKGKNALGAMLSEGWWSGPLSFGSIWNHFGDRQSLLAKLVISYDDGSKESVTTNNKDWKFFNDGPIIYSNLNMGEIYDATREKEIEGWASPLFNDTKWKPAIEVPLEGTTFLGTNTGFRVPVSQLDYDEFKLTGQIGNTAQVYKILTAKSIEEVRDGIFVYNMGQNIVGVPRIKIKNGNAGDSIFLRFSEMLYPDLEESGDNVGLIMTENYRAALCQDIYIMKDGEQVFQPKFTSRGYQFIEITGIKESLPLEAVQGVAISSVTELTADYQTSNKKVNQLWSNIVWSNVDNFLSIPTDCPQRNERMGWSGDLSVFSRTATYISNADQFLRRHMIAMRDVQTPTGKFADIAPVGGGFGGILWGSAGITVPWETYLQYNDMGILEENYEAMSAYMDHLAVSINPETGLCTDAQLGDWLGPQVNQLGVDFLSTAYHIYDLWIMIQVAELFGKQKDVEKFQEMFSERKEFFNSAFINEEFKTLGIKGGIRFGTSSQTPKYEFADTQTSYAVGLALGAFNEKNNLIMAKNLAETVTKKNTDDSGELRPEYSLMTGFIGTAWISKALSDYGYNDLAYKLLQNNQYPSWLYAIDQGATTIWERLNGYTVENGFGGNNSMNSFNHYSFGAVGQWMIAYSLGIQRDKPGFKHFILQPIPDPTNEMKWAEGYYDSMYGKITSRWEVENNTLFYNTSVPANTTATLFLPTSSEKSIKENGNPILDIPGVKFIKYENGKALFQLSSGVYKFESEL
ncbi:MAG: family 78 glycoside hydrolase catalytic domain [Mariniphaga sp.]|nr:family 78 glycoside hydrolase catalytic domain [Mariniphaga sp.]